MSNSNRQSLLHSYQSTHSLNDSRDFIQEKILSNLHAKRPLSQMTALPTSKASNRRSSITARSVVSQIDPKPDQVLQAYKLKTAVISDKRQFDNQRLEQVIMSRINAGLHKEAPPLKFGGYPDYYKNYKPKIQIQVTRNLTMQQEEQGRKLSRQMNHRFFVAGMAPNVRPEKANVNGFKSVLTQQLDKAGADLSLKVNQMKMVSQGWTLHALEADQQLQRAFIAFGDTSQQPGTITDQVRLLEAGKFQKVVNADQPLKVKDSLFAAPKPKSFRRGFQLGSSVGGWVGQGEETE